MLMSDRVAVVTGGGSGIGAAVASKLAAEGARVAVLDVNGDAARAVASELGGEHVAVCVDVSSEASVAEAFSTVLDRLGRIDSLVTSAGVREVADPLSLGFDEWSRVIGVNLTGTFLSCREAARAMRDGGDGGTIVCVASVAGAVGFDRRPAYSASKGGVLALVRSLMKDLAPHGIRVNAICPGPIKTPMTSSFYEDDVFARSLAMTIPLGKHGEASDVADAVLYLASDMSRYVSGVALPVDGGFLSAGLFDVSADGAFFEERRIG